MPSRTARVEWNGDFADGKGLIKPGSGAFEAHYSYGSIFRDAPGTNPMEILGTSLAACFSGALAAYLARDQFIAKRICTDAQVRLKPEGKGFVVAGIHLHTQAEVPGIDEDAFLAHAETAKCTCPVAQALGAIEITLQADLL